MLLKILYSAQKECRVVVEAAQGGVAPAAQKFSDLVSDVIVVY